MDPSRLKDVPRRCRLGALGLALAFTLTACGADSDSAATAPTKDTDPASASDEAQPDDSQSDDSQPAEAGTGHGSATAQIGGLTFEFSPRMCIVGEDDMVVYGPGSNTATGEIAFLDIDLTAYEGSYAGGVDIELGTDQPMTSPDDFYTLDPSFDNTGFTLSVQGRSFTVEGLYQAHGDAPLPEGDSAHGIVEVDCGG